MITFNENNNQLILTDDERQAILSKFPDKLKPFLSKCNNPLDETQVLINLFKDKNVRIILRQEQNLIGNLEYLPYFHTGDIAENVKYSKTDINHWASRWKINFTSYDNLLRQNGGVKVIKINSRHTNINANFINEQDLKKVLIKINTSSANVFQEWLLTQSTIMKLLITEIIKIKHEQDIQKIKEENDRYKQQLEQQILTKHQILNRTLQSVDLFKQPQRTAGKIYIASSPDYQKQYMYKIGLTTIEISKREKSMQTSCPTIKIMYDIDTTDVDLAESFIHTYLGHLNVDKEFFYISSFEVAKNIINQCVQFVNKLINNFDNDYKQLRTQYIDNITQVILPQSQNRGRSPVRRIGQRSKSPNQQLLITDKVTDKVDYSNLDVLVNINNNLKIHNIFHHNKDEKVTAINDILNINLITDDNINEYINNDSKTGKLTVKKYILSKIFKLSNEQITKEFLNDWLDKDNIIENILYHVGRLKYNDKDEQYINIMKQRKKYVDIILTVFGFKNLFDFTTEVTKDEAMENRMINSRLLEWNEYSLLMLTFNKRSYRDKDNCVFSVKAFIILAEAIFNEYNISIVCNRCKIRDSNVNNKDNRICLYKYKLSEHRKGLPYIL